MLFNTNTYITVLILTIQRQESLSVRYIRNIQTLKSSTSSKRKIPKAFEIFTDKNRFDLFLFRWYVLRIAIIQQKTFLSILKLDSSFILKAQNSHDAEKWIQYLQICKAVEESRFFVESAGSFFIYLLSYLLSMHSFFYSKKGMTQSPSC